MRRHAFLFRPWVCRFILTAAIAGGLATLAPPYLQEAEARPHAAAPAPERAHHPDPGHHSEPAHHPEPGHHPEHGNGPLADPGQLPKPRLKADPKADKPDSIGPGAFIRGPKPV